MEFDKGELWSYHLHLHWVKFCTCIHLALHCVTFRVAIWFGS